MFFVTDRAMQPNMIARLNYRHSCVGHESFVLRTTDSEFVNGFVRGGTSFFSSQKATARAYWPTAATPNHKMLVLDEKGEPAYFNALRLRSHSISCAETN